MTLRTTAAAAALALGLAGPAAAAPIAETAAEQSSAFAVVTLLLKQSGVYEELQAEGPFTLFAPTDNAFAKLPDETMAALLDPANRETLATLLRNHVVQGEMPAGSFIDQQKEIETLAGNTITVEGEGELLLRNPAAPYLTTHEGQPALESAILEASVPLVTILDAGGGATPGEGGDDGVDGSVVILPDITADNGIIHAISDVLVPQGATEGL